ncbi:MAG: lysophospholipid acyltransferase family protein [Brevefilum sp.]
MNTNPVKRVKYPRRSLIRGAMTTLGKGLLSLLANVEINGRENLPQKGPVILAGNHAAVLEAVMMAVYSPGMVEFLGNGDIPFDPKYAFIVKAYDLIPVNRGNLDRQALNTAVGVLEQGGILGIFPEGGIWNAGAMQAQIGAAWLSYRAQAPIIPIGFGGIRDGLEKAMTLQRPKLVMNIGEIMPPVTVDQRDAPLKTVLEQSAQEILEKIKALVPEEELRMAQKKMDEQFFLKVKIHPDELEPGSEPPEDLQIKHGSAYARFLYNPIMIDALVRNLQLPIQPIKKVEQRSDLVPVIAAWDEILAYLKINPGFFTYRFGVEEGLAAEQALRELRQLALWVSEQEYALTLKPIHRYTNGHTGAQVTEKGGSFPASMQPHRVKFLHW